MARRATALEILTTAVEATLKGDAFKAIEITLPEAFADIGRVGRVLSFLPESPSFTIEPLAADKGERFLVRMTADERVIESEVSMQRVKSAWRIAGVELRPETYELLQPKTAEEALKFACQAALSGNSQEFMDSMTSQAFVDLMRITSAWGLLPVPDGYSIEPAPDDSSGLVFDLKLRSGPHEVAVRATLIENHDGWLVSSLKLPGVRD
jgi:hypothetical protein